MIFSLAIRSTNRTSLVSTYFNSLVLVICSTFGEWRFRSIYLAAHFHLLHISCTIIANIREGIIHTYFNLRRFLPVCAIRLSHNSFKLSAKHWVCLFVSDFLFSRLSLVQTTDPIDALAGILRSRTKTLRVRASCATATPYPYIF